MLLHFNSFNNEMSSSSLDVRLLTTTLYILGGGLKMQKIFMTAKEVQDFLEVSRTTAYQLINEMNQELTKLGYRVQKGKVNRQYFMEKYCYGNEVRKIRLQRE